MPKFCCPICKKKATEWIHDSCNTSNQAFINNNRNNYCTRCRTNLDPNTNMIKCTSCNSISPIKNWYHSFFKDLI